MQLRKATRQKAKLRIGLSAASGFGKTYSALLLAFGITGDWAKVAVIDTEHGSAELYSNLGEYNALPLEAPFSPERYIQAIKACEDAGMEVIIIDSISHEWEGSGGCLEIHEKLGGRFDNWKDVTPRHRAFIEAILQCKCHVITTVRRKQDYALVEGTNKSGRQVATPQKVGMKEVTREGFEYELTLNLEIINDKHLAKASKDRTSLFMDKPEFIITEETGRELLAWAETGVSAVDLAIAELNACTDRECAGRVYNRFPQFQNDAQFMAAVKAMSEKYPKPQPAPAAEPEVLPGPEVSEEMKNELRRLATEIKYEKPIMAVQLKRIQAITTEAAFEALKTEYIDILSSVTA